MNANFALNAFPNKYDLLFIYSLLSFDDDYNSSK